LHTREPELGGGNVVSRLPMQLLTIGAIAAAAPAGVRTVPALVAAPGVVAILGGLVSFEHLNVAGPSRRRDPDHGR